MNISVRSLASRRRTVGGSAAGGDWTWSCASRSTAPSVVATYTTVPDPVDPLALVTVTSPSSASTFLVNLRDLVASLTAFGTDPYATRFTSAVAVPPGGADPSSAPLKHSSMPELL